MRTFRRRTFLALVAAVALPLSAAAQTFPSQPVRLIVPWPPGGSTDVVMRALADATSRHLGQPVTIENKPGAAGTLGAASVAGMKPDGYVVTQMPVSVFRMPFMQKVNFDPLKNFSYIIHVTGYTFGVVVRDDAPWKTWDEMIAWAKANPGKLTYGTPGAGTSLHITMEDIAEKRGLEFLHVPYKGGSEAYQALLGGQIMAVADSSGWAPQVEAGKFRLLVTWGEERTKKFPTVPTLKELGYGVVSTSPFGFAGPANMDPKAVQILHDAFKKGMEERSYLDVLERYDQVPAYLSPEDYLKFVRDYVPEQKRMLEKLGLAAKG
jgi:tripartite-type tricarboxylate transporter receptor subunit TctC